MPPEDASQTPPAMDAYAQVGLKLFGFLIAHTEEQDLNMLGTQLRKARISLEAREYLASAILTAVISGAMMFLFFHLLTYHPVNMFDAYSILLRNFIIASAISALNLGIFYIYPYYGSGIREADINANLIFGINHILAIMKAGGSFEDAMRKIAGHDEFGEFRCEAENFLRKMNIPNMTLQIALRKTADECPSEELQSILDRLAMALSTGAQAQAFLEGEFNTTFEAFKAQEEGKIANIQTLTHTYLVLLIVLPSIVLLALAGLTLSPDLSFMINQYKIFTLSPIVLFAIDILYIAYLELKEPEI